MTIGELIALVVVSPLLLAAGGLGLFCFITAIWLAAEAIDELRG